MEKWALKEKQDLKQQKHLEPSARAWDVAGQEGHIGMRVVMMDRSGKPEHVDTGY